MPWTQAHARQELSIGCPELNACNANHPCCRRRTTHHAPDLTLLQIWEETAAQFVSLKAQLGPLAALATRWRKLELGSWRGLLRRCAGRHADGSNRSWFHLHRLLLMALGSAGGAAEGGAAGARPSGDAGAGGDSLDAFDDVVMGGGGFGDGDGDNGSSGWQAAAAAAALDDSEAALTGAGRAQLPGMPALKSLIAPGAASAAAAPGLGRLQGGLGEEQELLYRRVASTLESFMQTSTLGEYRARLALLHAFGCHVRVRAREAAARGGAGAGPLAGPIAAALHNVWRYYGQFGPAVDAATAAGMAPIEKDLQVGGWVRRCRCASGVRAGRCGQGKQARHCPTLVC